MITIAIFTKLDKKENENSVFSHEKLITPIKTDLSPEEENREVIAWKTIQIRKFTTEHIDPIWAEKTQNQIKQQLELLKKIRRQEGLDIFELESIECYTTICFTLLRWKNVELAREASAALAGYNYRLPCATSSLIYDKVENSEDTPYRHEVIFGCLRD